MKHLYNWRNNSTGVERESLRIFAGAPVFRYIRSQAGLGECEVRCVQELSRVTDVGRDEVGQASAALEPNAELQRAAFSDSRGLAVGSVHRISTGNSGLWGDIYPVLRPGAPDEPAEMLAVATRSPGRGAGEATRKSAGACSREAGAATKELGTTTVALPTRQRSAEGPVRSAAVGEQRSNNPRGGESGGRLCSTGASAQFHGRP
jgi:hypothetical protein